MMQEFRELAPHARSAVDTGTSRCFVCGKSYEQVPEKTAVDHLLRTGDTRESIRDGNLKRQDFLVGVQSRVVTFISREVS